MAVFTWSKSTSPGCRNCILCVCCRTEWDVGRDHEHKACSVSSLQSLTQTCGDETRAVLLMARSGSGKNCGSAGKNQTQLDQSSMLTLLCLVLSCRNADSQLFDKVRGHDIKLLRYLSVRYICDLMVENKKVKFGLKWVWVYLFLCRLWFAASVALTCELLHSASWEQSLEEFYSRIG